MEPKAERPSHLKPKIDFCKAIDYLLSRFCYRDSSIDAYCWLDLRHQTKFIVDGIDLSDIQEAIPVREKEFIERIKIFDI